MCLRSHNKRVIWGPGALQRMLLPGHQYQPLLGGSVSGYHTCKKEKYTLGDRKWGGWALIATVITVMEHQGVVSFQRLGPVS